MLLFIVIFSHLILFRFASLEVRWIDLMASRKIENET